MNDDGGDGRERVLVDLGPAVAPMLLAVVGVEILRGATVLLLPALVEVSNRNLHVCQNLNRLFSREGNPNM